ncbi:MAG: hypothetical protein NC900_02760 [Candidatus Omnitrophica bacterium]|nr:hypothetical protein [Candidatus Omnitrophota bacterium]
MNQINRTHPGVAAVLSFIFNGLGQLYNGQIKKGLLIIFISSLSMIFTIVGGMILVFWLSSKVRYPEVLIGGLVLFLTGIILICIVGIFSIVDAYKVAKGS